MHKIISVGGSIIIPKEGFDLSFLKKFRALILERVGKGDKFVLVIGGGATCRAYQTAAKAVNNKLTAIDLDWLGIYATHFNAELVRKLFGDKFAYGSVLKAAKKVKTNKPIIISGGWKPGHSTDYDAVALAELYGAKKVINLSNVDYVYDSDPRINPQAKKIERISWSDYRKIVGNKWNPGAHAPFDPLASSEAAKLGLEVDFVRGTDLKEVGRALRGEPHRGTMIV